MKIQKWLAAGLLAGCAPAGFAQAVELEVTHWWTSSSEAAAVAEFANAFNATGNTWVDGAIAGGGGTALPVIISRIVGGSPMAATQLVHGRQAEELIQAGLMRDLTELAEEQNWRDVVRPSSLLDSCTYEGRIYCVPTNIHSQQWLWLSHKAFEDAGVPVPTNWHEFVDAAPALEAAGKVPLALGHQPFQTTLTFNVLMASVSGPDLYTRIYGGKDAELARGPEIAGVFEALAKVRELSAASRVQDWNEATNLVILGQAGGQIMGDWAQGEFQVAGQVAGVDYSCLPGLGVNEIVSTGGNAFYFPIVNDPEISAAQLELASVMISPETQVAFNLKKGSLPVRGDVDIDTANACMQRGLELLSAGSTISALEQYVTPDTQAQLTDLAAEYLGTVTMTAEQAQARFADIIANAD